MESTATKINPTIVTLEIDPAQLSGWKTILFNCNCHTFEDVIQQIIRAIQCTRQKASDLAFFADSTGNAIIYEGTKKKKKKVASVLGSIGLVVTVTQ